MALRAMGARLFAFVESLGHRRRSSLAAEVRRLADDPVDTAERRRVLAEMNLLTADWPARADLET